MRTPYEQEEDLKDERAMAKKAVCDEAWNLWEGLCMAWTLLFFIFVVVLFGWFWRMFWSSICLLGKALWWAILYCPWGVE